ncbi:MAG: hypothetical protein ABW187_05845 [Dokdonella sp.]
MVSTTRSSLRRAALLACCGMLFSTHAAQSAAAVIHGRIRHVDADTLDLCFDRGHLPAVGDHVALIRHTFAALPKSVQTMHSSTVGAAEIVALDTQHCAHARLTEGQARALDWVAAQP